MSNVAFPWYENMEPELEEWLDDCFSSWEEYEKIAEEMLEEMEEAHE